MGTLKSFPAEAGSPVGLSWMVKLSKITGMYIMEVGYYPQKMHQIAGNVREEFINWRWMDLIGKIFLFAMSDDE